MELKAKFGRRVFLAGSTMVAAVAHTGIASAHATTFEHPWTGGGKVRRAGMTISYRTLGPKDAEPIVLLHKVGGWVADWRKVAPLIGGKYRVIAIDLPGHGESFVHGKPPYVQTVSESAAIVLGVLDELGIDKLVLAGNSLGGVIGVQIAARWPERIRALVLASVSLYEGQSREQLAAVEAKRDPEVWTDDWRPLPRTFEQVARFGTVDPAIETEQNASRARADYWVRPSERGVALVDTEATLRQTQAPLLMIYADRGYYTKYIAIGRDARPDAVIVELADAGSFVHQEKPVETAQAITDFMENL